MSDHLENSESPSLDHLASIDAEIPEPVDHWTLDEFADLLPPALS